MRPRPQQNEHYYSSVPDEIHQGGKLSFTIKMRPNKRPKSGLQSDLCDLNKLTKQSRELAHSTEDILLTSTSTSGFSHYKPTQDFGDFQILTKPKIVDV